ncbi:MAG: aldehyde dehydrogenase family protein, partial [Boseongicola sp.]
MQDAGNFYINGKWVAPIDGRDFPVIDPSTEEPFATISLGGQADTDAAVAAAKAAFTGWRKSTKAERLDLLESILEVYLRRSDELAGIISREMGAPIDMAKTQQSGTGSTHIKAFIHALRDFEFEHDLRPNAPDTQI